MEILYSNKTDELIEALRITISETRFIFFFYFLANPRLENQIILLNKYIDVHDPN